MVNKREKQVLDRYEKECWKTIRCGAPDFLFLKVDNKGNIVDYRFVEVKNKDADLSYTQRLWKKVLTDVLNAKYVVEVI